MSKISKIAQGQGEKLQVMSDTVTIKATGKESNGQLAVVEVVCPPGGGPPLHRHQAAETFYVLSGELTVTIQDEDWAETVIANAGDTVSIPSMQWHNYRNNGQEPVRFLAMLTPSGLEDFFRELGVPVSDDIKPTMPPGPPSAEEHERVMQIINKYVEVLVPA